MVPFDVPPDGPDGCPPAPPGHGSRAQQAARAGEFAIRAERRGAAHVVAVCGELDLANVQAVEDELLAAETTDAEQILLDLSELAFLDSTGLRMIITASARSRANGDRLRLRRGPPQVQRIFEITATAETLPFAD